MNNVISQFNYQNRTNLNEDIPLKTPLVVYVEPSSKCNLECKFCPQHTNFNEFPKSLMSIESFEKLVNDIKIFENKPELMRFCGIGEPLFNKNFGRFIQILNESNVVKKSELITNGLLLNSDLIKIIASNLDRIVISIEGLSDKDYFDFTFRKIDFNKLKDKIEELFNIKYRKCVVHIKIHNHAVMSNQLKEKFFSTFGPISDEIYVEKLVDLWPEIQTNLGIDSGHRFHNTEVKQTKVCPQIFKAMQINADGRVLPCCADWKNMNIIGDIKNNNLHEIWNGVPVNNLRKLHLKGERFSFSPCKGCKLNEYSDIDNIDEQAELIYNKLFDE